MPDPTITHAAPAPLDEAANWVRQAGLSRRTAIAATAAVAGYALAAQPVRAEAIVTGADGLDAGFVTFPASDGFTMAAYRARAAGRRNLPTIVVVQEIFGVHQWIQDICRRLAHAGYYAIAPDLYARQGDPTRVADTGSVVREIVNKVPDAQVLADIDALTKWVSNDGGNAKRLGITGFCWGGRITWLYAAHNPALRAGVAWYGRLTTPPTDLQPLVPIDRVGDLLAPVLGLYGGKDRGIPASDVAAMNAALKAAGKPSLITLYPEADHGFLADYRPSYNEAAAKDAWKACLDWFAARL